MQGPATSRALARPRGPTPLQPTAPGPNTERLASWLRSPALMHADGRVLSWLGEGNTAFPYDEATAVLGRLHLWAGEPAAAHQLGVILAGRLRRVALLERASVGYVFDTGLALPLLRHDPALHSAVVERLVQALRRRVGCDAAEHRRWSHLWGPHLLKAIAALQLTAPNSAATTGPASDELVAACFAGGRFRVSPGAPLTYLHAHCYALEGLVQMGRHAAVVEEGVSWLAGQQAADGSLPAWTAGGRTDVALPRRSRPADVVAQAVRLWALLDPNRYAMPIARGLRRLASLQRRAGDGGLAYDDSSLDRPSWAAAFAEQAAAWAHRQPKPEELRQLV